MKAVNYKYQVLNSKCIDLLRYYRDETTIPITIFTKNVYN